MATSRLPRQTVISLPIENSHSHHHRLLDPTLSQPSAPPRSLPMSLISREQTPDINLARYRQYVFAQRRVSEWVRQTRPDAALPLYSRPKVRKQLNTNKTGAGRSSTRRSATSQKAKSGRSGMQGSSVGPKMQPASVAALVSSSVIVWALNLLASIVGTYFSSS
jgi:hypothetical protein